MDDLQVIDVDADGDDLAVGVLAREHAGVGVVERLEALVAKPGKELPLETPAAPAAAAAALAGGGSRLQ